MRKQKDNKEYFKNIIQHLNILYIEDEENIRKNIKKTLEMLVNNVFDASNIKDAKKILENKRIDIIISDINLEEENALYFIKDIRKDYFNNPIILLSAYTDKDYLLEATKLKLVDYLVKPIDFKTLNSAIEKAAIELIEIGNYIVEFDTKSSYNVLTKRLTQKNNKESIDLTAKEIELLELLIFNSNRIINYEEIKSSLWNNSYDVSDSALKNLINKLRNKIGKDTITNISKIGFKINIV